MRFIYTFFFFSINLLSIWHSNAQTCPLTNDNKSVNLDFTQTHIVEETGLSKQESYIIQVFVKTTEPVLLQENIIAYPISDGKDIIYIGFYNYVYLDKNQAIIALENIRKTYCDAFIKTTYYGKKD